MVFFAITDIADVPQLIHSHFALEMTSNWPFSRIMIHVDNLKIIRSFGIIGFAIGIDLGMTLKFYLKVKFKAIV